LTERVSNQLTAEMRECAISVYAEKLRYDRRSPHNSPQTRHGYTEYTK
jgi:hypothetical protein